MTAVSNHRLTRSYFLQDVLQVARSLPGKYLVMQNSDQVHRYMITDVEAYRGEEDQASHARRGMTPRTRIMYQQGGLLYIYLIYGMHWMLNVVAGPPGEPQAILIRGLRSVNGPGRLTRQLGIDNTYNEEDLIFSSRIWLEDHQVSQSKIITRPRVGIDYAGKEWREKPWRFILQDDQSKRTGSEGLTAG